MHLLIEILYTVYPLALSAIVAPLYFFFFVIDSLFRTQNLIYPYFGGALIWTLFPTVGVIFIAQATIEVVRKKLRLPAVPPKRWWIIWGMMVVVSNLVGLFMIVFPESILSLALIEAPYWIGIWLSLAVIGFGASCFYLVRLLLNYLFTHIKKLQQNPAATRGLLTVTVLLAVFPFVLLGVILIELFVSPYKNPQASRFAVAHAAIKNTCFIDPQKENCPQTLEEISYIEPRAYSDMMQGTQVNYVYQPDRNLYSLVVRYSPVNAVVFDWRFMDESTIDFKEYQVDLIGRDRLRNPPEWEGPWEFDEWDYSR